MNRESFAEITSAALRIVLIAALTLGASGCILRLTAGLVVTDDIGTFVDLSFDDVSVALCRESVLEPGETGGAFECTYAIQTEDGGVVLTSTATLLSELGVFGLLIDPVIVQVPANAVIDTATVDSGTGPEDLIVMETLSFPVQPGVEVTAEAGQKFWIVELPSQIEASLPEVPTETGPQFDFRFAFLVPGLSTPGATISLKTMFAGRVEVGNEVFYTPLLPCTNDFSEVPAIELSETADLSGLIFGILDLFFSNPNAACSDQVYDYTGVAVTPLQCDAENDGDVDRDDIRAMFAARNTPASGPDDPLDLDGDGVITILDARQCVGQCSRAACATE